VLVQESIISRKGERMIYDNMTLAFFQLGPAELIVIGILGVLIFGHRLPDVGRSLGKGIIEFKKGIKGIENEIDQAEDDTNKKKE